MGKKVLILSGGGGKGSFQAGVIEQLHNSGWRPDVVAGVSVGALNGAMVATGRAGRLTGLWRNIHPGMVYRQRGAVRTGWRYLLHKVGVKKPTLGYFDNSPLFETLRNNMGNRFITDFYCGSVNISTGVYYDHKGIKGGVTTNMVPQIVASTAIPLVFDPVTIRKFGGSDSVHVDGGVRHMSPIGSVLKNYEPDEVVIVTCTPYFKDWTTEKPARDLIEIAKNSMDILLSEIFEKDIREFKRINKLVRQANEQGFGLINGSGRRYTDYKAALYQPSESLGDSLNFTSHQALRNIDIGLNAKPIEL